MKIAGQIVDVKERRTFSGIIETEERLIKNIYAKEEQENMFILPGLIDAHIHIESSMSTPCSFAFAAVSRGTTGVVSDPHEIANVLGTNGVKYMIEDSKKVPLKFWFGAPSCVPATVFESAGATINSAEIKKLMEMKEVKYLAEMMNYPGVIHDDKEVLNKIKIAKNLGKPVDGHAPGLRGQDLRKYISAGITTDHECSSIDEAIEKIELGMKILIREGSAARNLAGLKKLFKIKPEMLMLCSDDLHPEMLRYRHINKLVAELIIEGYDIFDVIRSCTLNPVKHYGLEAGLLQPGEPADFIMVKDLREMDIEETWINGQKVYDRGKVLFSYKESEKVNKFNSSKISEHDIRIDRKGEKLRVIEAVDGELLTREIIISAPNSNYIEPDIKSDMLKIVVKDRYYDAPPAIAFISGFGLKNGAFASSVAHDSHNIIAIGTNDNDIVAAINKVVEMKGGLSVSASGEMNFLELPVAGIMSVKPVSETAEIYEHLSFCVKSLGCKLSAPFMTLSFMSLLVIPDLKLSDRGLFDGKAFRHVPLFME